MKQKQDLIQNKNSDNLGKSVLAAKNVVLSNKQKLIILILSAISLVISFVLYKFDVYFHTIYASLDVSFVALVLCGLPIMKNAAESIAKKDYGDSFIAAFAVIVCFITGMLSAFSIIKNLTGNYILVSALIAFIFFLDKFIKEIINNDKTSLRNVQNSQKDLSENSLQTEIFTKEFSKKSIPLIIAISLLVFCLFTAAFDLSEGLKRGVSALLVLSPGVFVIASKNAVSAIIENLASRGVLINGGKTIGELSSVDTFVFDKTGTLTVGDIWVDKVMTKHFSENELMHYAASCECDINHPIARAILRYYNVNLSVPSEVENLPGTGVIATVDGKRVQVVKWSVAEDGFPESREWVGNLNQSKTIIAVIIEDKLEGAIALSDNIRESAYTAVKWLNDNGYNTVLLTSDSKYTAKTVSKQLGIKEYHYNRLPGEKEEIILELRKAGKRVFMMGDGESNIPAFQNSNCFVAINGGDEKVAINITGKDIGIIPDVILLAKKAIKSIKINMIICVAAMTVLFALALCGLISPPLAITLHTALNIFIYIRNSFLKGKNNS